MRFTRLRLNGFKSFVDPTDLVIADGLTGVVGPNGCGKSNLLEALRWVMGENRPTAMRGDGMEDVIFAGASTRARRATSPRSRSSSTTPNASRPRAFNDSRHARDRPPHHPRRGLGLQGQRQGRPRARRPDAVRRRLDRRAFPRARPAGPDLRADQRQARRRAAASSRKPPASPASTSAGTRPS